MGDAAVSAASHTALAVRAASGGQARGRNMRGIGCIALGLSLGGCTSITQPSYVSETIPLSAIQNQIKCEIAKGITELDGSKLDIRGWLIEGTLTAKVVVGDTIGADVGSAQLLPAQSDNVLGFKLAATQSRSRTSTQVTHFFVSSQAADASICKKRRANDVRRVSSLGIYPWLRSIAEIKAGQPVMAIADLDYTLEFSVARSGTANADVTILPWKATANASTHRDDVETLHITFDPGKQVKEALAAAIRTARGPEKISAPGAPGHGSTITIFSTGNRLPEQIRRFLNGG
jgi:hypothetical protein